MKSVSPYEQSRYHGTPKLNDKEGPDDYEKRTWRNRMHVTEKGYVYIPAMAFKKAIQAAAKYLSLRIEGKGKSTYTKNFRSGIMVPEGLVTQTKAADVAETWLHLNSDGVSGSGKRVLKCMPVIQEWEGWVSFWVLDDQIKKDVFVRVLQEASMLIGVGTFRPENGGINGRWDNLKVEWPD